MTVPDSTLAKSEDAVEEVQQLLAGSADDARVFDLRVGHVVVGVVFELLGEDQQAVERRAELVRHVGDELGLVLRRDGKLAELAGLLLDQAVGLLDLLVPSLRLDVLLGEKPGLTPKVLIGLA